MDSKKVKAARPLDSSHRNRVGSGSEQRKVNSMQRNWDLKAAPDSDADSAYQSLKSDRTWDFKGSANSNTQQECDAVSASGSMLTNLDFRKEEIPQTKPDPGFDPGFVKVGGSKFIKLALTKQGASPSKSENEHHAVSLQDQDGPHSTDSRREKPSGRKETLDSVFERLEKAIVSFVQVELRRFQRVLASNYPEWLVTEEDEQQRHRDAVLNLSLDLLRSMEQDELAERLQSSSCSGLYQRRLKSVLLQRYKHVFEGVAEAQSPAPLQQIYTQLLVTECGVSEGGVSEVSKEHEVTVIEATSRKHGVEDVTVACEEVFSRRSVRMLLTKGVAGMGKTVLTRKFSLDWAEGRMNQGIQLLFPFTFRELNVLKDTEYSLVGLLHHCFSQTKGLYSFEDLQVLFIFDGLDECRLPLDFNRTRVMTAPTESASVEVLLVNLIRGNLLPSARLWITTRPAAANQIPAEYVSMVTEVQGFTDPQKEQYFRKRFRDEATAVISHIRSIRALFVMCRLPVFCWILSRVLLHLMEARERGELPHTLTQLYIHFLVVQAKVKNLKYDSREVTDQPWTPETREMVESLGKLAFEQLQNGNLVFYESDLSECGLDAAEVARYSGVFTEVLKEELGLYQDKVYCFIHLSVQEFLAALHVHQTFHSSGVNLLRPEPTSENSQELFYHSAIDMALHSPDGRWDLFLRFLLGLSLPSNQRLLQGLLPQTGGAADEAALYLKLKMNELESTDRTLNLFHCLHELKDDSLFCLIQSQLKAGHFSKHLSPAQWSALAFILLSSDQPLHTFDLRSFCASESVLLRLMPVVKASSRAILTACGVADQGCAALSKALRCESSCLRELDLSYNSVKDSGVQLLSQGLQMSHCSVQALRLQCCGVTAVSCGPLSSLLSHSSFRLLDLSNNDLTDTGVEQLSMGLRSPRCRLHTLRLSGCMVSAKGCSALMAALQLNPSHLQKLDLSYNYPTISEEKLLSSVDKKQQGSLMDCRLMPCGEHFLKPGLKKYWCNLSLDVNTAYRKLNVSADCRTVIFLEEELPYPDHLDRFDWYPQLLCSSGLSGRHYWEVEWSGVVSIALSYRDAPRRGSHMDIRFGQNAASWRLWCSDRRLSICTGQMEQYLDLPPGDAVGRVGVFLDYPEGFLSFYRVLEGQLLHLHTFHTDFTQPLFAGLGFGSRFSTATLLTK